MFPSPKPKPRVRQYYQAFKIPDESSSVIIKNCLSPGQTIYTQPSTVTPCINPKTKQVKAVMTISGMKNSFKQEQQQHQQPTSPKKSKSTTANSSSSSLPIIHNLESKISTIRMALRSLHLILITESIRLIDEDTLLVCVKHKESFNLNQFTNSLSGSKKDTLKLTGTGLSQPLLCNVVQI